MPHLHIFRTMLLLVVFLSAGCAIPSAPDASRSQSSSFSPAQPVWGVQMKTSGCTVRGALPDPACTPGAIFPTATSVDVCTPGYATSKRNVSVSLKEQVYAAYGIKKRVPGQYQIDHLISLRLGGSNDISNLWPEAANPRPGYREKDIVENYLSDQVCKGVISLKQAQVEISTNWLAVYNRLSKRALLQRTLVV